MARAIYEIWDITENSPIPAGAENIIIEDFDPCAGDDGVYIVSYCGKIYMAEPEEIEFNNFGDTEYPNPAEIGKRKSLTRRNYR